jgi:peptidyl-prolyl cis-trans isomerase C
MLGLIGLAATALIAGSLSAPAQDADPVVARVNGMEVRQSDLAVVEEELGSSIPAMAPEAKRDYLITLIADTMIVAQAAEAKGMADNPDFKRRLAFSRNRLLSETLLQQEAKAALTDDAMRKVYEEAVKEMGAEEEVRARHILFLVQQGADEAASKTAEDKAKAVIVRLKTGEDFAKVAGELTEDPSGKDNGGDLGYFTRDQMVPEFAEVAFRLQPGSLSDPVKTSFGWHVLKVEDKRKKPVPDFEQVKEQIETYLVRKAQGEFVTRLRAGAKIEKIPATPATPPAR